MKKLDPKKLDELKNKLQSEEKNWIKVGMSTCGIAAGAGEVYTTLIEEAKKRSLNVKVSKCGCLGMCSIEPLVEVNAAGLPRVVYSKVDKTVAAKIIDKHVAGGRLVNDHIVSL
jgi:(2Fe-2S) ferredoxin